MFSLASRRAARPNKRDSRVRVVLTRRAERQLDKLHGYIANRSSEDRADAYVGRIVSFCRGLAVSPRRGTKRDDLLAGLRTIGFERRATIAFTVEADLVVIEGIYYGGQDVDARLRR